MADARDLLEPGELDAEAVSMAAAFAAATALATYFIQIPVGPGYLNFGEIVIYTAAFLFGGVVGGLAGGIGAAIADVATGAFAFFAPFTLVIKGLEGYVVGQLAGKSTRSRAVAVLLGAPIMIVGYFVTVAYFYGVPAAVASELPIDLLQAAVGFAVALPLTRALEARIPRLQR